MGFEKAAPSWGRALSAAYVGVVVWFLGTWLAMPVRVVAPVLLAVATWLALRSSAIGVIVRVVGIGHAILGVAFMYSVLRAEPELSALVYSIVNVVLPLAAALFAVDDRPPESVDLPVGYEHLARRRESLSPARKLLLISIVAASLPLLTGGSNLLFAIMLLGVPIAFLVMHFSRMRQRTAQDTIAAIRRVRLTRRARDATPTAAFDAGGSDDDEPSG